MSGTRTDLRNLSYAFEKIKKEIAKDEIISKLREKFMRAGEPPSTACALAEKEYKLMSHENKL